MVVPVRIRQMISQLAVGDRSCLQTEICAGLVQRYRIERGKHTDIRKDRCVILTVAVTVRRYIHDQTDVEGRPAMADCVRILRDLAAEDLICQAIDIGDRVKCASSDAASAAFADIGIDICFAVFSIKDRIAAALFCAASAAAAQIGINLRSSFIVLVHLARAAASSHTDVLECTAEAGAFMSFEMAQRDEYVRIHQSSSDKCRFAVFSVRHLDFHIVRASQAVCDQDVASGGDGIESVDLRTGKMVDRVGAASGIQGVAVCQKRNAAQLTNQVRYCLHVIRTQVRTVAKLTEMHLDRYIFLLEIYIGNPGRTAQLLKLGALADAFFRSEVRVKYFRFLHVFPHFLSLIFP